MNSSTLLSTPYGVTACTMWSFHRRATPRLTVATWIMPILCVLRVSVVTKGGSLGIVPDVGRVRVSNLARRLVQRWLPSLLEWQSDVPHPAIQVATYVVGSPWRLTIRMNSSTLLSTPYGVTACTMWSFHRRATPRLTAATRIMPILCVLRVSVVTKGGSLGLSCVFLYGYRNDYDM
ncbi:MAG: hypothetical protein KatS3mg045_1989 [Bellilinea sp.]|jgi:hypothetical protein|nr:MAG: hypothetical protein KatS3mg045_1989 [Bellilinea sp.]